MSILNQRRKAGTVYELVHNILVEILPTAVRTINPLAAIEALGGLCTLPTIGIMVCRFCSHRQDRVDIRALPLQEIRARGSMA